MALPYKQNKITLVIKEMANTGDTYEINGIDFKKAVFMWRKDRELYYPIPTSAYRVETTSNDANLVITDAEALKDVERLQIISVINDSSSKYEPLHKADIETLKNNYNELVDNFKELFNYVKKTVMIADGQDFSIVLPTLEEGEVWVKTQDGWKGFQVGKLEASIQELMRRITESVNKALEDIKNSKENALLSIQNNGNAQDTRIEKQGDTQSTRLNSIDSSVSSKLALMERMMSIVVGANRWLDGGDITKRTADSLPERIADGGDITKRTTEAPRRIYDGGDITKRVVDVPQNLDLGEVN